MTSGLGPSVAHRRSELAFADPSGRPLECGRGPHGPAGGFGQWRAGRLVEQGEEFAYENVALRAEQGENTRIQEIRVVVDRDDASVTTDTPAGGDDTD